MSKTVKIDDISTYLKSDICEFFSIYNYNETERNKLRDSADFIRKTVIVYCENSLYENYNYKRNIVCLCELDAICYAYLKGYFKKKVKCHGYTLDGTSESREIKTVIEDLDKNISKNSNNSIYYFTFLNTLINRIAAKRGLYEQVYNVAIEFDALILKLETALFKKLDENMIRYMFGKILTISLPFFDTKYDKHIANLLLETVNKKLENEFDNIHLSVQEDHKSVTLSILSQEILFYHYCYYDKITLTGRDLQKAVIDYWSSESGIFYEWNKDILAFGYDVFKIPCKYIAKRAIFDVSVDVYIKPITLSQGIILEMGF